MSATTSRAALLALVVAGCANYSQLQDADTLPRDRQSVGVGLSFTNYQTDVDDDGKNDGVSVPAVVISGRRGLTDRIEGQATAWIPLGARAGVKVRLLGEPERAGLQLAVGAHVGYLRLSASSDSADADATAQFIDGYLPFYVGARLSPSFEVYAVPQYILRTVSGSTETEVDHVTGGTLGVAVGRKTKVYLEGGVFYDRLVGAAIYNTAVGLGL